MELKCKEHPFELGPGVCAACLRSRLLAIIAASQSASASAISPTSPPSSSSNHKGNYHNHPPSAAAAFPRSASPAVSHRRRSVDESPFPHQPHPLFYSTPQIAPRPAAAAGSGRRRFAVLTSLFRGDKDRNQPHPERRSDPYDTSSPAPAGRHGASSSASAPVTSWFTALVPGLRGSGRGTRHRDPEADDIELPSTQTGHSPSPAWRAPTHTPARSVPPQQQQQQQHKATAASGFSVCLSPLVRASPGHRRSQVVAGEAGISGELSACGRRRGRHQPDGAGALGPNRSRKLVDFGRLR